MIRIKGARDAAGERVRFDRKNIILAYTEPAAKAGLEPLPAHGVGAASPAGDYFVYVDAGESTAFVKACGGKLVVRGPDDAMYELQVSAAKMDDGGEKGVARTSQSETAKLAVHVVCHLEQGAEFRMVKKRDLKGAFAEAGFILFTSSRAHTQLFEGQKGAVRGTETEDFHLNVRPRNGTFPDANWPTRLHVQVKPRTSDKMRHFFVRYDIRPHALLPDGEFCRQHKVKKAAGQCLECKPKPNGKRKVDNSPPPEKKAKFSRDDVMAQLLGIAHSPDKVKMTPEEMAKTTCSRYMNGTCTYMRTDANKPCPFLHDPLVPPEMIQCALPKSALSGKCRARNKCLYQGCYQRSLIQIAAGPVPRGTPDKTAAPGEKRRMVARQPDLR